MKDETSPTAIIVVCAHLNCAHHSRFVRSTHQVRYVQTRLHHGSGAALLWCIQQQQQQQLILLNSSEQTNGAFKLINHHSISIRPSERPSICQLAPNSRPLPPTLSHTFTPTSSHVFVLVLILVLFRSHLEPPMRYSTSSSPSLTPCSTLTNTTTSSYTPPSRPFLCAYLPLFFLFCLTTLSILSNFPRSTRLHPSLVDIDIGTNGLTIPTSNRTILLTFDPTDNALTTRTTRRFPFAIADYEGNATFYVNSLEPGCSSLNIRNGLYNVTHRNRSILRRCPPAFSNASTSAIPLPPAAAFRQSRLYDCMHAPLRRVQVRVKRLSSVLKQSGFRDVNMLKIDAQGSDFAIVKELFENFPDVKVTKLQLECQDYSKGIPLYLTQNDCTQIERYIAAKRPRVVFRRLLNNCMAAEYNLLVDFT